MRIHKIGVKGNGKTLIAFSKAQGEDWEEHTLSSPDQPRDELTKALQDLRPFVMKAKHLTQDVAESLEVTGVTFSYKGEDSCKFVVTAKYTVADANGPENVSTSLRTLWSGGETEAIDQVDEKTRSVLDRLMQEVELYVNGTRKQMELPNTEAAA